MEKEDKEAITFQTLKEEIANTITHGIGIILSFIGSVVLLYNSISKGNVWHIVSSSIYGGALLSLYSTSTLYHIATNKTAKKVLRRLDHISIYLLIAGTYMPLILVLLRGAFGWTIFGIETGLCLIGVTFKAIFGPKYEVLSLIFYLLMGWLAIFTIKPIFLALSIKGLIWLLLGGFFYSLGVFFFITDKLFAYFHAIWHVFVLLGSICHFLMIFLYVVPFSI
jgi:hemolysin III